MGQFAGKTVMITGAAGAIAGGVVEKFAAEGANLVLVDHSEDKLKQRVEAWGDALGEYRIVAGDLGKPEDVDLAIQQAEAAFGHIDVLAHIAGGFAMGDPVHEADISVFEKMIYLNARLTFITCGRVAKHMVEKGVQGCIIGITARPAQGAAPRMAAYAASKAAAQRILESMAKELMEHNIRVNGLAPSVVDTPANRADMPNADFSKWVTPAQIADTIAFLASDAASAISGQNIGIYNKA
ncbi:MAG: SDR family oxidoreductase [Anaerolineae bacterium]|nr:SDR family oxidoreductase [Anaerolineae bacterium]